MRTIRIPSGPNRNVQKNPSPARPFPDPNPRPAMIEKNQIIPKQTIDEGFKLHPLAGTTIAPHRAFLG
jgi:hypothetical protein